MRSETSTKKTTLLTEGCIWKQLVAFAFPLFLGNLFQQLYNTADSLIVGNFLGSNALAAVSSSGNLIFLMVGFFQGISVGAGVVIARYYGAQKIEEVQKAVHTTVAFGLASGIFLTIAGTILTSRILIWMGTPADVLPESTVYRVVRHQHCAGLTVYRRHGVRRRRSRPRHDSLPVYQRFPLSLAADPQKPGGLPRIHKEHPL